MIVYRARGPAQLERVAGIIRGLAPDKPWRVQITPHRSNRSPEQNARLWSLYSLMAEGTGHTPEEIHEAMKAKFLPRDVVTIGDEEVPVFKSSAKLDVSEFSTFMEQVESFAASELGVALD